MIESAFGEYFSSKLYSIVSLCTSATCYIHGFAFDFDVSITKNELKIRASNEVLIKELREPGHISIKIGYFTK